MFDLVSHYWPHILAVLSIVLGTIAAIHATMTKDEVRTALGWVGVIVLSPIVGAVVYALAGSTASDAVHLVISATIWGILRFTTSRILTRRMIWYALLLVASSER